MSNQKKNNVILTLVILITLGICLTLLWQNHRSPFDSQKELIATNEPSLQEEILDPVVTPDASTPAGQLMIATQKLLQTPVFQADISATMNFTGKMIHGRRKLISQIQIADALSSQNLQMFMTSKTIQGKKAEKSSAFYHQGWYCVSDKKHTYRIAKDSTEILNMVTFIYDILQEASDSLEDMTIQKNGSDTVYSFTMPADLASDYFSQMIQRAAMNTKQLNHVTGSVDTLRISCTVSTKHILRSQTVTAIGTVSKSIFTVPVRLKAFSCFVTLPEDTKLKTPALDQYSIRTDE